MTVTEYAAKFNELARFAESLVKDEMDRVERFKDGLNWQIQQLIAGSSTTFQEAYDKAINQERIQERRNAVIRKNRGREEFREQNKKTRSEGFTSQLRSSETVSKQTWPQRNLRQNGVCRWCGKNYANRPCRFRRDR